MSLLVISEFLGLFVNTLTADNKSSLRNSENLRYQFKCNFLRNKKLFSEFFTGFLKSKSNFERSGNKLTLIGYFFPKS